MVMSIIYPVLAEASFNCEKSGRETFLPDVGQRSRATIPGDDPGDQQPSEDTSTVKRPLPRRWGYGGRGAIHHSHQKRHLRHAPDKRRWSHKLTFSPE